MAPLALLCLLAASPARAARLDWDADRKALLSAANGAQQGVKALTALALDSKMIATLKGAVDDVAGSVRAAAQASSTLDDRSRKSFAEIERALKGSGSDDSPAGWLKASEAREGAERDSLKRAQDEWQRLKDALDGAKDGGQAANASQRQDYLRKIQSDIDEIDKLLASDEDRLKRAKGLLAALEEQGGRAKGLEAEEEKAAGQIAEAAGVVDGLSGEAKARIDALGTEPQEQQRARAAEKISALTDRVDALFFSATVQMNRTDDFARAWSQFQDAKGPFQETRDAVTKDLSDARTKLDFAASELSRLKSELP